ncbi:hypothetical protein KRP22_003067 [Phytophthora ramorum]|uniref:putative ubiquitin-like-specific protease 2A n=1 Tax=Phytophthora ramorum TaxID=164328 RepID=UPI0030A68622|nr:putative ubiquitin-like-specific protease 2A [Phytophthora ramorum]KAH7503670.1 putative ubiquitin-like-specific protease 2A [Phytophthora ramorum]
MADRLLPRRFGKRFHDSSHAQVPSGQRPSSSFSHRFSTNTLEFSEVAERTRRRTIASSSSEFDHRRRSIRWTEEGHSDFHFGDDGHSEQKDPGGRSDKYLSTRPKASGQSIGAPGSSIVRAKPSPVSGDAVLNNVFKPPAKQNDFLTQITIQNTNRNRGPGTTLKTLAYQTPSSLEAASAPVPKKDVSQPARGSSGWVNTRPARTPPKPRIRLESTDKRLKLNNERKTSPPVTRHYTLRDRTKPRPFEYASVSAEPFTLRSPRLARLGKRKMNSEGSAAMPIALDSDSGSEPEVQSISDSKNTTNAGAEGSAGSQISGEKEVQVEKQPVVDLEDIESHSVTRIHNCDVMIGLFQCLVDLLFQGDRMCMRNIRAKYDKWPFKPYYLLGFKDLRDVRYYDVSQEADASNEIDVEESDRMEQLLDEASFLAFKCHLPAGADRAAMKSFYDPSGSDASKAYFVLRPLEDATGSGLDEIIDTLRAQTDIMPIIEKDQAKEHLQALVKDPFIYRADRRSRRRKNTGENEDSLSDEDADEDDIAGNAMLLTYPLPPCTSDIVTIIGDDVSRLKPRRYLNDNIIDYYFKRMMLENFRDNEIVQDKVLFLSSHFYSRLRAGKGSTASARMETGYKNVSTWLARSNFFKRSIIFIPINKDVHWSLAIILNPGLAGSELCNEDDAFSCIAVLDPLGSYHRKAAIIRNLRAFLRMEWENSRGRSGDDEMESASEYGIDRVLTMNVKAPLQENSYDCGVYVLKFAEVILKNCLELGLLAENGGVISKDVTDDDLDALITSSAFSAEDIRATRKQIRQYIKGDASEYQVRKKEKAANA